jgi:NAD/NADP transhydrogenase beta subunit
MNKFLKLAYDVQINPPGQLTKGPATLAALLDNIFKFLNYTIGVIGVIMIVFTGFLYITSLGNPQKTKQALQSIIYTAVGFTVAILARSIAEFILPKVAGATTVQGIVTEGITTFTWVIGIAALIVMIIAGILYVVSVGEPQKTKTAKDAILYSAIGLVVALIAGSGITALNTFLTTGHL